VSAVANVGINVDARGATAQLRQLQTQAGQTERAFGGLTTAIGRLAVAAAAIQATRFVFAKTAELETQTRSLQVLTGSAEKAKAIIQDLQKLGAVTPFTSTELIDAAKRLQAFGVEANKVVETTKRLADVSGATGAELQGLVTAYGQVQAKGRLQAEELLQFQERGVALQKELQRMYGMSGEEFQKALSKGQISAKAVEVAVQRLTDAGGKYANGAIAQSDTLAGKFSTLQDGIDGVARQVGTVLAPAIKKVLNEAIYAVNAINDLMATGARAQGFGMNQSQRSRFFKQAESTAQQIVESRFKHLPKTKQDPFEINKQFVQLREQVFKDLIESYGYSTGQIKAPKAATAAAPASIPSLLGGTAVGDRAGGGGKVGGATAKDELAAVARLAYGPQIIAAAKARGLDPRLLAGLVQVESNFRPGAVSSAGAIGLTQLMPSTAAELGVNPRDPMQNLLGGAKYLRRMIDMFGGVEAGLRAYNQGPGNQQRFPGGVTGEARSYPGKVLAAAKRLGFGNQDALIMSADAASNLAESLQQSIAAGQKLSQEFNRQIELRTAATKLERDLLQIGYDQQDRQQQINELTDAGQRVALTGLNNQIQGLATLNAQLNNIYERAGFTPGAMFGAGAGAFRTDINLDPLAKASPIEEYAKRLKDLQDPINQAKAGAEAIGDAFNDAFSGILSGTQTTQEALSNLFRGIATSFMQMATQMITEMIKLYIFKQLTGLLGVSGGGGGMFSGASVFSSGAASFNPASFGAGLNLFPARAMGGAVAAGQSYIVGERGPELFTPSVGGTISGKVSSGTTTVTVNVDASGTSVQGDDQQANQLGRIIGAAVQAELVKAKRRGGILNP
jgi:tape measure domain-containing protein